MIKIIGLYIWNIGVGLSQLIFVFLGGDPDESISGATGKAALQGKWWAVNIMEPLINFIFYWDYNHCRRSIEDDEGGRSVIDWYDKNNPVWRKNEPSLQKQKKGHY